MRLESRPLGWLLVVVWFAWLSALQQRLAGGAVFELAAPDLGMVFFAVLLGVVRREDVFLLGLLAALGRKTFSVDPGVAILGGYLALAWLASVLRGLVELESPLWRGALAAAGASGLSLWLEVVRFARAGTAPPQLDALLPLAFTSGLAALALGGVLARLPGLTPLRGEESW